MNWAGHKGVRPFHFPMPSLAINRGIVAALWIPTDANGQVLDIALARQIDFIKANGCHAILALGSTGEFVHFSELERARLLGRIVELAAPLPVMANVSDVSPLVARHLAKVAEQAGCASIAVLPPWYFAVGQDDLLAFFLHVADATSLPTLLYNFPERTGNRIALETIAAFTDRARMAGVKQSGAEFGYHRELIALGRQRGFPIFTGADLRLPETLDLGCSGTISGLANLTPDLLSGLFAAWEAGRADEVSALDHQIGRAGQIIGQLPFPLDVSAGVLARGLEPGAFKSVISVPTHQRYVRVAHEMKEQFQDWGLAPAR
jgi:dihydrodipicolinate synthase/N-acetylneuraminate lyase